jgi:hypothetical protein
MLDYANEPWIKSYTRDTGTWVSLRWQTRGLILEIARKVDKAGVLHPGKGGLPAVARLLRGHVRRDGALPGGGDRGGQASMDVRDRGTRARGARERQESRTSDAQRKRHPQLIKRALASFTADRGQWDATRALAKAAGLRVPEDGESVRTGIARAKGLRAGKRAR